MSLTRKRNSAATKIQKLFRKRRARISALKSQLASESCALESEPIRISDENLYMFLKDEGKVIPLFSIFNFIPNPKAISNRDFFEEFYTFISNEFHEDHPHSFKITKKGSNIEIKTLLLEKSKPYRDKFTKEQIDGLVQKYETYMDSFFIPYIFYILANSKIDLDDPEGYTFDFSHPFNVSGLSGIHKDYSMFTCITYINSPATTELAFDVAEIKWIACSPLFRFENTGKLYTLCFNDQLMIHTMPIYEEEGKDRAETNAFEDYETVRSREGYLEFGTIKTASSPGSRDRPIKQYQYKTGEVAVLEKKEKVDSKGNPYPIQSPEYTFVKQHHRTRVPKPKVRKILASFIYDGNSNSYPSVLTTSVDVSIFENFKIGSPEEQIQLSEGVVDSIITQPRIGAFKFKGGRKSRRSRIIT